MANCGQVCPEYQARGLVIRTMVRTRAITTEESGPTRTIPLDLFDAIVIEEVSDALWKRILDAIGYPVGLNAPRFSTKALIDHIGSNGASEELIDVLRAINELGLNAMFVPEACGGAPVSYTAYLACVRELSKACAATGSIWSTSFHAMKRGTSSIICSRWSGLSGSKRVRIRKSSSGVKMRQAGTTS